MIVVSALLLAGCGASVASSSQLPSHPPGPHDWPTYGHDAQHTFHGVTSLTPTTAGKLRQAWFFPTGDAVTATPTVVNGTVYAGSWDGNFYAVELATGALLWKYRLQPQHAVTPYPGENPRDGTSDGGLVTSSAWYEAGDGSRPDLVIFGGGYTLYALDARTGGLYWSHDYTGRPEAPPDPSQDGARIFSSPVVVAGLVLFGVDVDGSNGYRGYIAGADLATGRPVWEHQTDADTAGRIQNDGCGNIWSSGTVLPRSGLVVFDVADCNFANPPPLSESVVALHVADGRVAWVFRPARSDTSCDLDFGATPNAGIAAGGGTSFLGVGGKDGTYYSLDPNTGREKWATNVVFGGFSGGFIGTTAFDGRRVYGSTAIGDFGRFEHGTKVFCDPANPRDLATQEPSVHSFDARTGAIAWQGADGASFAPTTVAGGMTFNGPALGTAVLDVRLASTGRLIDQAALPQANWSGVATVGNAVVLGVGSTYNAAHAGIVALTPGGTRPVVPG
ncbi:MAG TPA: PQQ-binding-like beta-propeller repeat protein [Acidimicrobiales bacterium]